MSGRLVQLHGGVAVLGFDAPGNACDVLPKNVRLDGLFEVVAERERAFRLIRASDARGREDGSFSTCAKETRVRVAALDLALRALGETEEERRRAHARAHRLADEDGGRAWACGCADCEGERRDT